MFSKVNWDLSGDCDNEFDVKYSGTKELKVSKYLAIKSEQSGGIFHLRQVLGGTTSLSL